MTRSKNIPEWQLTPENFPFSGITLSNIIRTFALSLLLLPTLQPADDKNARLFVTSEAGDRMTEKPPVPFHASRAPAKGFAIDETVRQQEMVGFGASFLESGMMCLNTLNQEQQKQLLKNLFDTESGAGFSAMKTDIAATDFMAAGPFYSYDDHPGDTALKFFSIKRDLQPDGVIPFIKRAKRYGRFALEAPMDYPPDWMLMDVNKNQDVNPKYFDTLANYYVRYAQAYQREGIFVNYISLFNEPSIYTKISAASIRDLLAEHVGPAFTKARLKNRLIACEPDNRNKAWKYWSVILNSPQARQYVGAIAFHGYQYKDYQQMAELHKRYPGLKLWMTEVCHAYETGDPPRSHPMPNLDYADGDFWGNQIFSDLESGTSAWIYWNMILDENGGPWSISPIHENPDNNNQHPVLIVNRHNHQVTYTGLYYYLAHFSRFVRPGSVRIGISGEIPGVRCMAFQAKDKSLILEVMNRQKQDVNTVVRWQSQELALHLPALSIATYLWN